MADIIDRDLVAENRALGQQLMERTHVLNAVVTKLGGVVLTKEDFKRARGTQVVQGPGGVALMPEPEEQNIVALAPAGMRVNGKG